MHGILYFNCYNSTENYICNSQNIKDIVENEIKCCLVLTVNTVNQAQLKKNIYKYIMLLRDLKFDH